MENSHIPEGVLLGIGNPLLDISAIVDEKLLRKYDLKPDDAIMAEEKHMPLYEEIMADYNAEFIAGGSVQNSLRVAQWILKKPKICTYFGCVGFDDYAKILKERATADGVQVYFQETRDDSTGRCAVLVTGTHRSLCAHLAAARRFTPDHLMKPDCKASIEKAKFFYASGFFVAVSPESIMHLARQAYDTKSFFIMNLSAPFVSQVYIEEMKRMMPYVDVLFGNESEAVAFAQAYEMEENDLQKIALKIAALPKVNKDRERVVVITQGCCPVILVEGKHMQLIPVEKLERDQIVDTNGAGDAFAGGFLSQMVLDKPYKTCVQCGIYAATHIIKHPGCTFSGESAFEDFSLKA